jgi:hypothetical protein
VSRDTKSFPLTETDFAARRRFLQGCGWRAGIVRKGWILVNERQRTSMQVERRAGWGLFRFGSRFREPMVEWGVKSPGSVATVWPNWEDGLHRVEGK